MRIEKLEERSVMDAAGMAGFCTAFESPAASVSLRTESAVYGPFLPTDPRLAEFEAQAVDEVHASPKLTKVDYDGTVIEVGQLYLNMASEVGRQPVPSSTGVRAALDILEASAETDAWIGEWANDGIKLAHRAGDIYYFEFHTPPDEYAVLGTRALFVDIATGTVFATARF